MDSADKELLVAAMDSNYELKRLYDEHCRLNDEVARLERRGFLTESEKLELKRLKRDKLKGRDQMLRIARASDGHKSHIGGLAAASVMADAQPLSDGEAS